MAPASQLILKVSPRGKPIKALPHEVAHLDSNNAGASVYRYLASACQLSPHRLRVSRASDGSVVITNDSTTLAQLGLKDGDELFVKDLGPQISWRTVYVIEYIGALIAHPLLYAVRLDQPTPVQTILVLLMIIHFVKREVETLFVHRFGNATMPFSNIFKNSFHYWILSGVVLAWAFYSPSAAQSDQTIPTTAYIGLALFALGEIGNLYIHLVLRNLRPAGTTKRAIPQGLGFDWVTCPNYMYETLAWIGVLVVSRNWAVVLFIVVGVVQMRAWAWKKEFRYRSEFPNEYKHKRYVVLPGIC